MYLFTIYAVFVLINRMICANVKNCHFYLGYVYHVAEEI